MTTSTERPHSEERPKPATIRPLRHRAAATVLWIAALAGAPLAAQAVECLTSDTASLPAPSFQVLRGYRASFETPARLAADELGHIFVADPARGTVLVRDPDGRIADRVQGLGIPASIAVDGDGNRIYVGDGLTGSVTAYSSQWQPLFQLGNGSLEFSYPADIAVDRSDGSIWVADSFAHRIKAYDSSGARRLSFGDRGAEAGQFQFPMGIHVDDGTGEVLVTDQQNGRLQIFDRQGAFVDCIGRKGSGTGRFNMPQGVATDGAGRIYVSDAFEGWVHVVDRQGATLALIGEVGEGRGRLSAPSDLVIDPSGRLFVSSATTAKLEMFGLDSFSDPEQFAPAELTLRPAVADADVDVVVSAILEVPGYALTSVTSISANGISPIPGSAVIGDHDHDGVEDLRIDFGLAQLASTLEPSGSGPVFVTGLVDGLQLDASASLRIRGSPGDGTEDADGDGVADAFDLCPDTSAAAPVSDRGCSIEQLCPCSGPGPEESWRSHGEYVSCVTRGVREISRPPFSQKQRTQLIMTAAKSGCGR